VAKVLEKAPFKFNPNGIPPELKEAKQWVVWSLFESDKNKPTKNPCYVTKNGTVKQARWAEPENQYSFDQALEIYESNPSVHGLGFVLTKEDPYVFIDIDNVGLNDPRSAYASIDSWSEFSQSGKGLHIMVKGKIDGAFISQSSGIEIYSHGRFIAMTGTITADLCMEITERQNIIEELLITYSDDEQPSSLKEERKAFSLPEVVNEGSRDDTMYRYCCKLFSDGLTYQEVVSRVIRINNERFVPPLDEEVVKAKVEGASKFMEKVDRQLRAEIFSALEESSYRDLAYKYVFLRSTNRFMNIETKTEMSIQAFNQSMPNIPDEGIDAKGKPKLEMVLPSEFIKRQEDYKVLDGVFWRPTPFGKEIDPEFLYMQELGTSYINTWRGFALTPIRGNVKPWLRQLRRLIPEAKDRKVFIQRMAIDVQMPHEKVNWQILLHGGYGVGKDSIIKPFQRIFGSAFKSLDGSRIGSGFDDELIGSKVLLINEVDNAGRKPEENSWIKRNAASEGASMIMLNKKMAGKVLQANVSSLYLLSNEPDCLKFTTDERRFYVIAGSHKPMTPKETDDYYGKWFDKGGANALFDFLMRVNITISSAMVPERTEAFYNMIEDTQSEWEIILSDYLSMGKGHFAYELVCPIHVSEHELVGIRYKPSIQTIKKWMMKRGFHQYKEQPQAKIDGKIEKKSRTWLANKALCPDYHTLSGIDLYHKIDEIESKGFIDL